MKPIPLMLLSDSPDAASGLARITRDLATRLYKSNLPVRVATAGFGGFGSVDMPFPQYSLGMFQTSTDIPKLIPAWQDFTKGEKGILLCIYDVHRLEAFRFANLYQQYGWDRFLGQQEAPFFLAGYIPIDSEAPKGLTQQSAECLRAFDFLAAYGNYGKGVLDKALGTLDNGLPKPSEVHQAPHGIDFSVFKPQPKGSGRARLRRMVPTDLKDQDGKPIHKLLEVLPEHKLIGAVMTNQMRKDWGSFFEIASFLPDDYRFWIHTDKLINFWSLPDLMDQFGVTDKCFVSMGLEDSALAELYSDCDLTLALGLGEGYGYPIAESMACGTPALHCNYGGGADLLPEHLLVEPKAYRIETPYTLQRPVTDSAAWADRIQGLLPITDAEREASRKWCQDRYDWSTLWNREWKPMFESMISSYKTWKDRG